MILFSNIQIEKIKQSQPLTDSKFNYNVKSWLNLHPDFKKVIQDFEDKEISRQDIVTSYKSYFENSSAGFMKAFLLTMIWGFGDTGYGTYRTNKYITLPENVDRVKRALDYIKRNEEDSLRKTFTELGKIKGLGISYLTKILHFATRATGNTNYALIFDLRVATALIKLTTPQEIVQLVTIAPSSNFNDYVKYNQLIHKLAEHNNIEAEQIEMYLFNQEFS